LTLESGTSPTSGPLTWAATSEQQFVFDSERQPRTEFDAPLHTSLKESPIICIRSAVETGDAIR
jgi:hypothetical protein